MKFIRSTLSLIAFKISSPIAYGHDHHRENFHLYKPNHINNHGKVRGLAFNSDSHCGYKEPLNRKEIDEEVEARKNKLGKTGLSMLKNSNISIDVYFHVFTDGDNGYLSNETIAKQMDILNDAYSGAESSYSACGFDYGSVHATPFRFNLAEVEEIPDSRAFDLDSSYSNNKRRDIRRSHSGSCEDMHVYTGTTEYLGWASFPADCAAGDEADDGVVINYGSLPDGHIDYYNQGDTLVHEVGHWLGLYHTFQGGCGTGDTIDDTPAEQSPAFGCPIGRDTCGGGGDDPIHNFMDYTDDCCMYRFTEDQTDRMVLQADIYRGLKPPTSSPTLSPIGTPTASPTRSGNSPTVSPTASPTESECDVEGMSFLAIQLKMDSRAENDNNLFKLAYFSDAYNRFKNFKEVSSFENDEEYTWGACVPKDTCYRFTITDDSKDGICCESGEGFYSIDFNEEVIQETFENGGKSKAFFGNCSEEKMTFTYDEEENETVGQDISFR